MCMWPGTMLAGRGCAANAAACVCVSVSAPENLTALKLRQLTEVYASCAARLLCGPRLAVWHTAPHLPLVHRMKPRVSIATPVLTTRSPMYQLMNELLPAEWLPTIITLQHKEAGVSGAVLAPRGCTSETRLCPAWCAAHLTFLLGFLTSLCRPRSSAICFRPSDPGPAPAYSEVSFASTPSEAPARASEGGCRPFMVLIRCCWRGLQAWCSSLDSNNSKKN